MDTEKLSKEFVLVVIVCALSWFFNQCLATFKEKVILCLSNKSIERLFVWSTHCVRGHNRPMKDWRACLIMTIYQPGPWLIISLASWREENHTMNLWHILVILCYVPNCPNTYWLKTVAIFFVMPCDFVGEEFGQGSAAQLLCSMWHWLRPLGGIQPADGQVWRVQDSFVHESGTSVGTAAGQAQLGLPNELTVRLPRVYFGKSSSLTSLLWGPMQSQASQIQGKWK